MLGKQTSKSVQRKQGSALESQTQPVVLDDTFFEAKRVRNYDLLNLKPPKPETAPNKFLAKLFDSPQVNTIQTFWIKERVINFMKILGKRRINMIMLRSLAFRGVPNEVQGLRSVVWRVLLGYLPRETAKWEQFLK